MDSFLLCRPLTGFNRRHLRYAAPTATPNLPKLAGRAHLSRFRPEELNCPCHHRGCRTSPPAMRCLIPGGPMKSSATIAFRLFALTVLSLAVSAATGSAEKRDSLPPLSDMSVAGQRAALWIGVPRGAFPVDLPDGAQEAARTFALQTKEMGLVKRSGLLPLAAPTNVMGNNPAGDAIGETQSEVSVAVL